MRIILPLPERNVVVRGARTQQIVAMIVERVQNRRRVVVVHRVRVAVVVVLSTEGGSSQGVDVCVSMGSSYAGSTSGGCRFRTYGTLLTWGMTNL